jgi:hypothetical protein
MQAVSRTSAVSHPALLDDSTQLLFGGAQGNGKWQISRAVPHRLCSPGGDRPSNVINWSIWLEFKTAPVRISKALQRKYAL